MTYQRVMQEYRKSASQIADDSARKYCGLAGDSIAAAFAAGKVFASVYDSPEDQGPHSGMTDAFGNVHIESGVLLLASIEGAGDEIRGQLLLALLHEGLHVAGRNHDEGQTVYADPPWKYFNPPRVAGVSPSPCVRWP